MSPDAASGACAAACRFYKVPSAQLFTAPPDLHILKDLGIEMCMARSKIRAMQCELSRG